jgi:hypothetical protein
MKRSTRALMYLTVGLFGMGLSATVAHAAKVKAIQGKRVLIDLESDTLEAGQILEALGPNGKPKGLLKIQRVKGQSALAVLGRGTAGRGDKVRVRTAPLKQRPGATTTTVQRKKSGKPTPFVGVIAGISMSSASVNLRNPSGVAVGSVDLSGMGFNAMAHYDYPLMERISFRGLAGIQQFNVGGQSNSVCGTGECDAKVTYISGGVRGRYHVAGEQAKFWVGGGFDFMFPLSKSSTALDKNSITNTSIMAASGGLDWYLDANRFIPVQLEYGMYPSSDQVKANVLMIRGGYSWRF